MIAQHEPSSLHAASLASNVRQDIGIQVPSRSQLISQLATTRQGSRKFVYQQGDKAEQALNESFAPSQGDDDVLFKAQSREAGLVAPARDVKTLLQWFSYDVLALAGPDLAVRQELFSSLRQNFNSGQASNTRKSVS